MIKLLGKLPQSVYLAFSGGIDSVVVSHFLLQGKKDVKLLYFNHMTDFGKKSVDFVKSYSKNNNFKYEIGNLQVEKDNHLSKEEFWRIERYKFFSNFNDRPIITCHHLNDQIENWIFTSLHGNGMLIPYRNGNIIRPFLLCKKQDLIEYAKNKNITEWMEDPSNLDNSYMRNYIRNNIVQHALNVNNGLYKTIAKKVQKEFVTGEHR